MNCATCEASRAVDGVLMCRILAAPANIRNCRWYVYEPGTTDELHHHA